MAVKKYKPLTPGRRNMTSQDFTMITAKPRSKQLLKGQKSQAGRNSQGRVSVRHRGGGVKRRYRVVHFNVLEEGVSEVIAIEYDPNRSARLALIKLPSGKLQYILASNLTKVGDKVSSTPKGAIKPGNRLPLSGIPVGTIIHSIEILPNSRGKIGRAAGTMSSLLAIEGKYAMVKLPSGEIRQFLSSCKASIGQVGNIHHNQIVIGKAGRQRLMGIRPTVRGKAMNPVDHPHGGGEGGSSIGMKAPKTRWGAKALGVKTRKKTLPSNRQIIKRRKSRRK